MEKGEVLSHGPFVQFVAMDGLPIVIRASEVKSIRCRPEDQELPLLAQYRMLQSNDPSGKADPLIFPVHRVLTMEDGETFGSEASLHDLRAATVAALTREKK